MSRSLYEPEHEALRESVREFIDRHVRPYEEDFIARREIPREVWLEAGKQGLLGLEVPEEYGGGGVARLPVHRGGGRGAVGAFSVSLSSCWGIHADVNAPYLIELTTEEQRQRWLPGFGTGELVDRHRDDRAVGRVGPRRR